MWRGRDGSAYIQRMVELNGAPISDSDARTLVDLLMRVGRADDLSAASVIEYALAERIQSVDLSEARAAAVLGAVDDPPDGGLSHSAAPFSAATSAATEASAPPPRESSAGPIARSHSHLHVLLGQRYRCAAWKP